MRSTLGHLDATRPQENLSTAVELRAVGSPGPTSVAQGDWLRFAAGNVHRRTFVKKRRRQDQPQVEGHEEEPVPPSQTQMTTRFQVVDKDPPPWMNTLASLAAASRTDGGAGLQLLLQRARF